MADPTVINKLVEDPTFLQLPDEEKKYILSRAAGGQAPAGLNSPGSYGEKLKANYTPAQVPMVGNPQISNEGIRFSDRTIDMLRPIVAGTLGHLAGTATAATGVAAPAAPAADLGTYAAVDTLLQYLKKEKPADFGSAALEGGGNALVNKVLSGLTGMFGRGVKAFNAADQPEIYNFAPTTSQAASALGAPKLAMVAKTIEDFSLTAKQKALDRTAGAGFTQALQTAKSGGFNFSRNPQTMLDVLNEDFGKIGSPTDALLGKSAGMDFNAVDKVIADPRRLTATLSTAQANGVGDNLRKSLQGYQFMKMYQDATTSDLLSTNPQGIARVNPAKISSVWDDPKMQDSFKELYNARQRADIDQFFKNIAYTQDKMSTFPIAKKLMALHGGIAVATGLFTGSIEAAGIASSTAFIGTEALGKLLTNPKTARYLVAMAGGEPLGASEQYVGKLMAQVLQGSTISLINEKGQPVPVMVDRGKFVPIGGQGVQ